MFRRNIFAAALLTGSVAVSGVTAAAQSGAPQGQWATIQTYCVGCHNSKVRAGGRAFDAMSPDQIAQNAETWEAAIRKLRGSQMPPPQAPHPDAQAVAK